MSDPNVDAWDREVDFQDRAAEAQARGRLETMVQSIAGPLVASYLENGGTTEVAATLTVKAAQALLEAIDSADLGG